jgi:hypothetical protein
MSGAVAKVPIGSALALDLIRAKVPLILRTFPDPETHFTVTVTKPDQFWRLNGKIVPHGFAKAVLRRQA